MKRFLFFSLLLFLQENLSARLPDLIPYRKGKLWGYCDSTKKMIIEPKYDVVTLFRGNTAVVRKDNKFGIVDKSGKLTVPLIYDEIMQNSVDGERIVGKVVNRFEKFGIIDEQGKIIIPIEYFWLQQISEKYIYAEKRREAGIIDRKNNVIIPFNYGRESEIDFSSATYGLFVLENKHHRKEGSFGVVDSTGKIILPFIYDEISFSDCGFFECDKPGIDDVFSYSLAGIPISWIRCPQPHKISPIDTSLYIKGIFSHRMTWQDDSTKIKSAHVFRYTGRFYCGNASFMNEDSLWGFVNDKFEIAVEPKYGWADEFHDSLARVYKTPPRNEHWYPPFDNKFFLGYIDVYGTEYWEE